MRFFEGLERRGRAVCALVLGKTIGKPKVTLSDLQQGFERGDIRKILLVRNYQGMGDLLCASPVISALKARFPAASIHFLANTFNAAALDNNPGLIKIWAWDERRKADPRQWIQLTRDLRHERFDMALVLSGNALSLTAILLAVFSGARWVLGYETGFYGQTWGERLYSYEVPVPPVTREIDKYAGLLEGLGIACPTRAPEFYVRPSMAESADAYWKEHFVSHSPVVGIFLGGKVDRPDRIWPPEDYARVARRLVDGTGCAILAIAPPLSGNQSVHQRESTFWKDEAVHERLFREAYGRDCPVFRDANLSRVAAILQKLDLLICPDGGMMHLAAAVRVPTLTLFFGTNPEIWHPPVPSSYCLTAPGGSPRALTSEKVAEKAEEILKITAKLYENR